MNKICILAAGKGTRCTSIEGLHKALFPLGNVPVISHIINKIPHDKEIIIATGHKSQQIKSYIKFVYPERNIIFVDVDKCEGEGSGPGYSLLSCKKHLQEPFVFTAVDTIVNYIPFGLKMNWGGVSFFKEGLTEDYCLIDTKHNKTTYERKKPYDGCKIFCGIAGIQDYKDFWRGLEQNRHNNQIEVTDGLQNIKVKPINFEWTDTGNDKLYEQERRKHKSVVLDKKNEVLFIDNGKVVKYFVDSNKSTQRVERTKYLNGICPNVSSINDNMFGYEYINGTLLSNVHDEQVLKKFLNFCESNLFVRQTPVNKKFFKANCKEIYLNKTINRVLPFVNSAIDQIEYVNGVKVKRILETLEKVNWDNLVNGAIASLFHGDGNLENIIYDTSDNFVFIDWRESFGSSSLGENLKIGDIYYDLGKIYHALLINGEIILKNQFDVQIDQEQKRATIEFVVKSNLLHFKEILKKFCEENSYNWKNVQLVGILQYLSVCSLYTSFKDGKYGDFLFLYGKFLLTKFLHGELA